MKKTKSRIGVYSSLIFILTLILFVGTFISFNLIDASSIGLSVNVKNIITIIIGFVVIISFLLIIFWMFAISLMEFLNSFKIDKNQKLQKYISFVSSIIVFSLWIISATFYIINFSKLINVIISLNSNSDILNELNSYFRSYLIGDNDFNFIWSFIFVITWSIMTLIFSIVKKVIQNNKKIEEKNELSKENIGKDDVVVTKTINKKNTNNLLNENSENEIIDLKEDSKVNEKNKEDDLLNLLEKGISENNSNNEIKNNSTTSKTIDPNDPYSIFD